MAIAMKALLNKQKVVAIIDTGSSGVVISESCFRRLGLIQDGEVEFLITSATDTNRKHRKIIKEVEIEVGKSKATVPAIKLEGLHFNVLLGMNWLKAAGATIDVVDGTIRIAEEKVPYTAWPEPALFVMEDGTKVYSKEFAIIEKGKSKPITVCHEKIRKNEAMFLQYTKKGNIQGDFLAETNEEGFIEKIEVEGRSNEACVLQKGQCVGWLFPLMDVKINKVLNSYFVFQTLDLSLGISHLKGTVFKEMLDLLIKWLPIFSRNKYDVGLTQEEYVIRLNNNVPVKSYTPRNSPAVKKAIEDELFKLEKADFIELSISPYSALRYVWQNLTELLESLLTFKW